MFEPKKTKPSTKIDTLIGLDVRIEGDVEFAGGLRVEGTIVGSVVARPGQASTLTVCDNAVVQGRIDVAHVIINGTVSGPVRATASCELQSKAKITGDIEYGTIEIQLGAVVKGHLVQHDSGAAEAHSHLKLAAGN